MLHDQCVRAFVLLIVEYVSQRACQGVTVSVMSSPFTKHMEPGTGGTFDTLGLILPNTPNIPPSYMYALNGACFFISLGCLYRHLSIDTHPTVSSTRKHRKHLTANAFYRQSGGIGGVHRLMTMEQRTNDTRFTDIKLNTICRAGYTNITNGFIL